MSSDGTDAFANLRTQDGHMSDLSLDRFLYEEMQVEPREVIESHLNDCEGCRLRLDAIQRFDADVSLSPPRSTTPDPVVDLSSVRTRRHGRPWTWMGGAVAIAAAAMAIVVMVPDDTTRVVSEESPKTDGIRMKGSAFSMVVQVADGPTGRTLQEGDRVYPNDQISFQLHTRDEGHVMVLGRDATQKIYPCYPHTGESESWPAIPEGRRVPDGITFDPILGDEQLIAVWCPGLFTYAAAAAWAIQPEKSADEMGMANCRRRTLTVTKIARTR